MWFWLAVAISTEITGTLALKVSDGFTRPMPGVVVVVGYAVAFFALSRALVAGMDLGLAYALWAGIGVAIVAVAGVVLFGDSLNAVQIAPGSRRVRSGGLTDWGQQLTCTGLADRSAGRVGADRPFSPSRRGIACGGRHRRSC